MSTPLAGFSVVVTRAREQAGDLTELLEDAGAEVLPFPAIRIVEPEDWGPADDAIGHLDGYDWIVFTSANAVAAWLDRLAARGLGADALAGRNVAAVGPATESSLAERGVAVSFVPADHRAEGVLAGLLARGVGRGSAVLVPRALEAREILPDELRERGATVDVVPVYRTVLGEGDPTTLARLVAGSVDAVTFTSSSTARNFVELTRGADVAPALERAVIASIGPVTTRTLVQLGLRADVESGDSTAAGLVSAIAGRLAGR